MDAMTAQFEALYDEHVDAIFRYLLFRLGDRERAKEITQEVFMRLWRELARGETISYPKAFLYKIAHNLFINEIRTDKQNVSLEVLIDDGVFEPPDMTADVVRASEHAEALRFLAALPTQHQEILTLRYLEGLPVKEIAEVLGEKETTISMRLSRALEHIRKQYPIP